MEGRLIIARNTNWTLPAYLPNALTSPIAGDRLSALEGLDHLRRVGNELVRETVRREIQRLTGSHRSGRAGAGHHVSVDGGCVRGRRRRWAQVRSKGGELHDDEPVECVRILAHPGSPVGVGVVQTSTRTNGWLMLHRRLTRDHDLPSPLRRHDPPCRDRPHGLPSLNDVVLTPESAVDAFRRVGPVGAGGADAGLMRSHPAR
jgi:hypothetical protein